MRRRLALAFSTSASRSTASSTSSIAVPCSACVPAHRVEGARARRPPAALSPLGSLRGEEGALDVGLARRRGGCWSREAIVLAKLDPRTRHVRAVSRWLRAAACSSAARRPCSECEYRATARW